MSIKSHPFLLFLEQHKRAIDRLCRSFARGNGEDEADLRQEVVLRLWKGWPTYRKESKPITWLWRVAYSAAIDWWRNRQRYSPPQQLHEYDLTEEENPRALLEDLLQTLPPGERSLIQLFLPRRWGWLVDE